MAQIESAPLVWGTRKHPLLGDRELSAEQMWDNYQYFMKAVLPVAEEAGVNLALHPDDPPVPCSAGSRGCSAASRAFKRAVETFDSPQHGLDFCMGCWSEMGPGAIEAIRYFGARGKIFYVHFRDVQGHVPVFQECFLGEGNVDVVAAMRALKESASAAS